MPVPQNLPNDFETSIITARTMWPVNLDSQQLSDSGESGKETSLEAWNGMDVALLYSYHEAVSRNSLVFDWVISSCWSWEANAGTQHMVRTEKRVDWMDARMGSPLAAARIDR